MIRSLAIAVLCAFLAFVFWLGATVYSDNIEMDIADRTQQEIDKHRAEIPDISRTVDGRDVTVYGATTAETSRTTVADETYGVWGVRALENDITVVEASLPEVVPEVSPEIDADVPTPFYLHAEHTFPNLWVTGQVDEPAYDLMTNVHQALPPETTIDYSGLEIDDPQLPRSARIVETGIAAVTQLNPGTLTITDTQFTLEGTVFSEDRKRTVEQLIDVRRAELEPLDIVVNIYVESPGITQACRDGIDHVLANNVLNYAVNHYKVLDNHLSVLKPMADTILGVCQGQIETVLVEGHADYTGGAGYNQGLSERRSGTVRDYLIEQGVDAQLISAFGYGEFRPIASNETVDGRSMNRRTEIYLLIQDQITGESIPGISLIEE